MAQSGYTPILLYYSTAAAANPSASNLASGELAINITDGKLYYKDNSSAVQVIGWKTTPTTAGGTGLTTYATGDLIYASATNTLSKLAAGTNGQVLTLAGGVPTWAANTGGVTSFQTSLSGLTPSTSSTGAITLAGTLGLGSGGTGFTTYATGDLIYASATNTLSKRGIGSNGQVLTVVGGIPTWAASTGGVTSFQTSLSGLTPNTSSTGAITLAGTLGATSGGTGASTYVTGDVLYASATNTLSKLAAGTNGYVLTLAAGVPSWAVATSGATGGGSDQVFFVNGQTVTTNYTIPSGKNAMSGGPITVSSGIVVTVPSGSKWTVVG
jgi:hypothetical protein